MNKRLEEKVSNFLTREFNAKLGDKAIFLNEDGTYEFFNKYCIKAFENGYEISFKFNSNLKYFSTLKSAVTWCIFDVRNKLSKTQRIEYLDKMLSGTELNILQHRKLVKKTKDLDLKLIFLAKLSEDENKKKAYLAELSEYINESKIMQSQNFAAK